MKKILSVFSRNSHFKLKEDKLIEKIGLLTISVSLVIIMLITSLLVLFTKNNRQKELISDGYTLSNMIAGYSVNELKRDNANKVLQLVNYTGGKNGLIYSIIIDTNHKILAYTGSSYVNSPLITERAASLNNSLKHIYKDVRTNNTIYEFTRPLYENGKLEGNVKLGFSPDANPLFSPSEIRGMLLIATLFFSLVPIFYYLVRGSMQLHTLSITDELTGVYNRRGFFSLAEECLMSAKRAENELMLLYADVDNLKEINDSLGHEVGDRLIKKAADILKSTYRASDIIARIGGDEFVVFPVGTGEENASIVADRLQKNIDKFNAKSKKSYKLRISTGIAMYDPNSVQSIDELLAEADALMYKQKKNRKNALAGSGLHIESSTCPVGPA